ncbi:MAG: hypothetical protein GY941_15675 [Planctomycetes bacterium]|nr:hypothetical protein [Planctomycetota bacterium]
MTGKWIKLTDQKPKEDGKWLNARCGGINIGYPVKWWDSVDVRNKNGGYFVTAAFTKESHITHWRIKNV